jgi:predicted metalloprotease with PDZ domain
MAQYTFTYDNAVTRLLKIEAVFENIHAATIHLQLPAWRPGRYELGNFAQNIISFQVLNENDGQLSFKKITKDRWEINANGSKTIKAAYTYYAAELNAGSTFLCNDFLYVNPVNCCVYIPDRIKEACEVRLKITSSYDVAIGLPEKEKGIFTATDFHQLADSPFIAGIILQHKTYESNGTQFYVWFNGKIEPEWEKLLRDFKAFADAQFVAFGSFPFPEFHFMIHALPYSGYHGVEHLTSTVITLGPAEKIMNELYDELLGVSSHELYHCWNVKTIRPADMLPYDYTRENYSRLGYVAEGVTTYYGDQFLLRSHVFSRDEWKKTFDQLLERHFQNPARFNMSVADSSFDTWLDGYKQGAPNRKVSIYTEGALCAFMCDMLIRKNTNNHKSLDDAMLLMDERFGKTGKGYTEKDYQTVLEEVSGISFDLFFKNYINGTHDYLPLLKECLDYIGYELLIADRDNMYETAYGFKVLKEGNHYVIKAIFPGSEAEQKGMELNDKIIFVNSVEMKDINQLNECAIQLTSNIQLQNTLNNKKEITLTKGIYYKKYTIERIHEMTEEQARNYALWAGVVQLK